MPCRCCAGLRCAPRGGSAASETCFVGWHLHILVCPWCNSCMCHRAGTNLATHLAANALCPCPQPLSQHSLRSLLTTSRTGSACSRPSRQGGGLHRTATPWHCGSTAARWHLCTATVAAAPQEGNFPRGTLYLMLNLPACPCCFADHTSGSSAVQHLPELE